MDEQPDTKVTRRVCLVTGGTGGIGTEICKKFASLGHIVATTYRNDDTAKAWQEQMLAQGFTFHLYKCDVGDFDQTQLAVNAAIQDLGPIQILVNNAGTARDTPLRKMRPDQWREVISSNLDSVFNVTRAVLDAMVDSGFGRIINISSLNAQRGQYGQTNYTASKTGVHGFTKSLALEVARKNVTVNTISPGCIATGMVMALPEKIRQAIIDQIPLGRPGKPEEVAHVVAFLADEASAFITGANISVNGGHRME